MFSVIDSAASIDTDQGRISDLMRVACDQCRMRKVRCSMGRPCAMCSEKGFNCTFERPRKKRGPQGKRIKEIRRQQKPDARDVADQMVPSRNETIQSNSVLSESPSFNPGYEYTDRDENSGRQTRVDQVQNAFSVDMHSPSLTEMSAQEISSLLAPSPNDPESDQTRSYPEHTLSPNEPTPSNSVISVDPIDPSIGPFQLPSIPLDYLEFSATLPQPEHVPSTPSTLDYWPAFINEQSLLPWIDTYFKRLHQTVPVLNQTILYQDMLLRRHRTDRQFGAMVLALCAFAMTQPIQIEERASTPSRTAQVRILMEEAVRMRNIVDFGENPSLQMLLASFFLFATLFGNNQHKAAWHKLREAVDLAFDMGLHSPVAYQSLSVIQKEQWLRTYLVLSVTERAYALQRKHSIAFRGRPGLTARFMQQFSGSDERDQFTGLIYPDRSDAASMTGLVYLMESFDAIDESIIDCWNGNCAISDGLCTSFDRRKALQMFRSQIHAREACFSAKISFAPNITPLSLKELGESQRADILITQDWLLNRLWNLCISHNILLETSDNPELRYSYAFDIAYRALNDCNSLSLRAMEVHGIGLVEKIYDIATGIVTAVHRSSTFKPSHLDTTLPAPDDDMLGSSHQHSKAMTLREVIAGLSGVMSNLRGGDHQYGIQFLAESSTIPGIQ